MLRHVDLCSGIGGFSLAFEEVGLSKTIMFCDTEKWCRDILAKHWPNVPITEDVKELANDPERNVPDCDILTAGYPCQPFSVAGKQRGTEDDRHIWPYIFKIVAHKRPTWCVFENVYGHVGMGLDKVLHDLESSLYSTRTFIVGASGVGAPHKRSRLWIIAHTDRQSEPTSTKHEQRLLADTDIKPSRGRGFSGQTYDQGGRTSEAGGKSLQSRHRSARPSDTEQSRKDVAHTGRELWGQGNTEGVSEDTSKRSASSVHNQSGSQGPTSENVEYSNSNDVQGQRVELNSSQSSGLRCGETKRSSSGGQSQPKLVRMVNGLPSRMDGFDGWGREPEDIPRVVSGMKGRSNRLKGLGNAIVPRIAMNIGLAIKEMVDA